MTTSQCTRVLDWLALGKPITAEVAKNELGIARLAARIADLREAGNIIHSKTIVVRNRFGEKCRVAEYTLLRTPAPPAKSKPRQPSQPRKTRQQDEQGVLL